VKCQNSEKFDQTIKLSTPTKQNVEHGISRNLLECDAETATIQRNVMHETASAKLNVKQEQPQFREM
jgi:hypothetical protein